MSAAATGISAFILGASGECGKELVKELAKQSKFTRVTLIGRRLIDLPSSSTEANSNGEINYSKFEQKLVDFDNLSNFAEAFKGYDVGFCALGTTREKAGKDGFYKVDHDYVVNSAKLAKDAGCKHFNLVSSANANKNSMIFYTKVKGQVDEEVCGMGFDRVTIAKPGLLLCDRTEQRTGEKIFRSVIGAMDRWSKMSVQTSSVAHALVSNCLKSSKTSVEVLDNAALNALGKEQSTAEHNDTHNQ